MSDCVFDPGIEERLVFEIAHHVLHVRRLNTLKTQYPRLLFHYIADRRTKG